MGSCSLLQGILPTQGWNPGLPHRRRTHYLAPVFLPGKSRGQTGLGGLKSTGLQLSHARLNKLTTAPIHIFFFKFFSLGGYDKISSILPCSIQEVLVGQMLIFLYSLLVNIPECSEMIPPVALHEVGKPARSQGFST